MTLVLEMKLLKDISHCDEISQKMELTEGAEEIFLFVFNPEIAIPVQIIGQETEAEFKAEQADGIIDRGPVYRGEESAHSGIIASQNLTSQVDIESDQPRIPPLFTCRITAGTETVTNVIQQKPRTNRVQVDQADRPAALPIE